MVYVNILNRNNHLFRATFYAVALLLCVIQLTSAKASELNQTEVQKLIDEMVAEHGFSAQELTPIFSKAKHLGRVIKAMSRPAEKAKPWYEYRKHFIGQTRNSSGVKFWQKHETTLKRATAEYGVPAEIFVGSIGVETSYVSFTGKDRVIDALATLAFHYPESRKNRAARMAFFRSQLKDFLILAREQSVDPLSLTGSYAGAMGIPQFMPESYRKYAVDFNGDGRVDIWQDPVDAIGSVANYLANNGGWVRGKPVVLIANIGDGDPQQLVNNNAKLNQSIGNLRQAGVQVFGANDTELAGLFTLEGSRETEYWVAQQNFRAIMKYNPRTKYAMAVYQLANEIYQARMQ